MPSGRQKLTLPLARWAKNYKHKMHIHLKLFLFLLLDFVVCFKLKFTSFKCFDIRFTFIGTDHLTFRGGMFFLKPESFVSTKQKSVLFFLLFSKNFSFKTTGSIYRYLFLHVASQDLISMKKWNGHSPRFNISPYIHQIYKQATD